LSGWTAGELAKEIEAGYWYVGDPDAALDVPQEHRRDVGGAGDAARQRAPGAQGPAAI